MASFEIVREIMVKPPVKEIILRLSKKELEILERNTKHSIYADDCDLLDILQQAMIGSHS